VAHAHVTDVPQSWEGYERVSTALGREPLDGLILHAAGRTDEGFRIIEVWETKEAWQRFRDGRLERALAERAGNRAAAEPAVRELAVERLLRP
jgi:heme-degrading monooxygenase HmoA